MARVDDQPTRDPTRDGRGLSLTPAQVPAIVLLWAREEPARVGEVALLAGAGVLGRGGPRDEDPAPRLMLGRQRPGGLLPGGPLESGGVSRIQLSITPVAGGVRVKQLAKRDLKVNGKVVDEATVPFDDTFEIDDQLLFLVTRRAPEGPAAAATDFGFGEADRHGVVGESPAAWDLRAAIAFAARAPAHVLIHGPSGTGKELVARAIHAASSRGERGLVSRNAATLPEGLIDAELFGNVRGYPNPGMAEREGLVGEADGSSLFLDEIGELPATLQAHLLRLLDRDGEYQRLGDARTRRADLRVIAATNRDPASLKHDLAARLAVRVAVPGLPARREDVPLLLQRILGSIHRHDASLVERFHTGAGYRVACALVDALVRHRFSTHVRELERAVWAAVADSRADTVGLGPGTLSALTPSTEESPEPGEETTDPGADAIRAALAKGGVTSAAKALGLRNRYVLYRLMKKHGIEE